MKILKQIFRMLVVLGLFAVFVVAFQLMIVARGIFADG